MNVFNFILYSNLQLVIGVRDPDIIATLYLSYCSNLVTCQKMVTTYDAFVVYLRNIVIQIKNNYC